MVAVDYYNKQKKLCQALFVIILRIWKLIFQVRLTASLYYCIDL